MLIRYKATLIENVDSNMKNQITSLVDKTVDDWIASLQKEIMTGTVTSNRGLWDRFKNFLSNVWYGHNDPRNPYYFINKYGYGLGQQEEYSQKKSNKPNLMPSDKDESPEKTTVKPYLMPSKNEMNFTLKDYKILREMFDHLECNLNEDNQSNLRLFQIINRHAEELKSNLKKILIQHTEKFKMPELCYSLSPEDKAKICGSAKPEIKTETPPIAKEEPKVEPSEEPETLPEKKSTNIRPKEFSYTTPPTEDKKWDDLSDDEKDAWNKYGGGISPRNLRTGSMAALHGVAYPQILRIGDPRRDILKRILPNQKNKNKSSFDYLLDQGRVELQNNPIQSKDDLDSRIRSFHEKKKKSPSPSITPSETRKPDSETRKPDSETRKPDSETRKPDLQPQEVKNSSEKDIKTAKKLIGYLEAHELLTDNIKNAYDGLPESFPQFREMINNLTKTSIENIPERFREKYTEEYSGIENFRDMANLLGKIIHKLYDE
jgi:hypothetical protein